VDKPKVLFLCTGNSARSQIAEAFLRTMAGDRYEAFSAGLEPKEIHPLTRKVMSEADIDISQQYSKALKDYMGKVHFSHLITVCSEAEKRCPTVFPGMGIRLHWNIEDPAAFVGTEEEKLAKFREIREVVKKRVQEWLASQKD
jgi:arsenate reductase (thioredoxin)